MSVYVIHNLFKVAALVMGVEVGSPTTSLLVVRQQRGRHVGIAHQAQAKGFYAVVDVYPRRGRVFKVGRV